MSSTSFNQKSSNSNKVTLDISAMKCAGCVKSVEKQLTQSPGVISARVNLITEVAVVEYEIDTIKPETLAEKLTKLGFPTNIRISHHQPLLEKRSRQQQQLWQLVGAAVLLFFSLLGHLEIIGAPTLPILSNPWFHWILATLAVFLLGLPILIDGWRGLWHKMPNMNTLVGIGTFSAYLTSSLALWFPSIGWECFFDEPVMLLGFILLGRTLETRARNRASSALKALISLQPSLARLISKKTLTHTGIEIPVEQIRLGEWVQVLSGEKIPVDGEIIKGETTIDESTITGESVPVNKKTGDGVSAGTINQTGVIIVEVTRVGQDTTLAQIIRLVEEAQTRKAPIQKYADIIAGYFAYGVMTIALITFLFWYFIGTKTFPEVLVFHSSSGHHLHHAPMVLTPLLLSLKLAIATLVVACPCALGLATPTAILVGTSMAAERGILIQGGDILEKVHQLDTIVFDKTGTLTQGNPSVTDCLAVAPYDNQSLLQIAATAEILSNHPLAKAIVEAAINQEITILPVENWQTTSGLGISALVEGKQVYLGNAQWLEFNQIKITAKSEKQAQLLAAEGKTIVYLAIEQKFAGLIALQDCLRQDALETVQSLQKLGLRVVLLTGDRLEVAEKIAKQLGIKEVFAGITPQGKAEKIQSWQKNHSTVAMVGDGVNDAPALAQSDIGISLYTGTDVARETASIVLMQNRLLDVIQSIELSLATFGKIRQNLFWAFSYNLLAIPIAAGIFLPKFNFLLTPATAAILMASSSLFVLTNSLFLYRQKFKCYGL